MTASGAHARIAWSLFGLAVLLACAQTWMFVGWSVIRANPSGWPVLTLGLVLWTALGAVIISRHPRHRVAWVFVLGAVLSSVGNVLSGYSDIAARGPSPDPPAVWSWLVWLALMLDAPEPLLFLVLLFLLFPTGHLASRRWRPVLWTSWASFAALIAAVAVDVPPWTIDVARRDELYEGGWSSYSLVFGLFLVLLGCLLAAAASVVVRLRQAQGVERQQLRWLAVSAAMVAVAFLLSALLPWQTGVLGWLRILPLQLAVVAVVVGAALAILRYRLYDLDVVVSRAILLTASTVVVAALYTLVVVLVRGLLPGQVRHAFWPSLLATATVALAFQPLRSRIVRFADRMAFGPRAVPYEALAAFGRQLEAAPGAADLLRNVAHSVAEAGGGRRATAVLELPDGSEVAQSWPTGDTAPAGEGLTFPIVDRGERLGRVALEMPPGRPLRPDEESLVQRLLAQTGLAIRNLWLETELAGQVEELRRHTAALEASRRQLLLAGDEERARFATALQETVLPYLLPIPDRLQEVADRVPEQLDVSAERDAATAALEALRTLVHGSGPVVRQRSAAAQAASSRSGPKAGLGT